MKYTSQLAMHSGTRGMPLGKFFENACYLEIFHIKFYAWFGKPTTLEVTFKIWELWASSLEHTKLKKNPIL